MQSYRIGTAVVALTATALCLTPDAEAARRSRRATSSAPTVAVVDNAPSKQLAALGALDGIAWGMTLDQQLVAFRLDQPGVVLRQLPITGLGSGESLVGIDVRPRTGELYGLSTANLLYRVDAVNGAATAVGSATLVPGLDVASFGVDFNPVPDRLRVIGSTGQNLRLNPDTGQVASRDPNLMFDSADPNAGVSPRIVAAAYTNSFLGATRTTNYAIDANLDMLVTLGSVGGSPVSPNSGRLFTVGPLGVDADDDTSLDIDPATGKAYAVIDGILHTVDLTNGTAQRIGPIGSLLPVRDLAIAVRTELLFALTADGRILTIRAGLPGSVTAELTVTGVPAGERLLGIDVRPKTAELYAIDSASHLYRIDIDTGQATAVGAGAVTPPVDGFDIGLDFNPVADRLRLVTANEQNLRLNPDSGALAAEDARLSYDAADPGAGTNPRVVGAGYTNNRAGATSTTLYLIDAERDQLVTQGSLGGTPVSPNSGRLFSVGALGVDVSAVVGFDIARRGDAAFLASTAPSGNTTQLYTVNLNSGTATLIGEIAAGGPITDIAVGLPARQPALLLTH